MSSNEVIHISFGRFVPPTETKECPEVIWSNGKSCRKCPITDCYRNGWLKKQVDQDNKRIVERNRFRL